MMSNSDGMDLWDRVSYQLGHHGETDSGVNSMDFHDKLKLQDDDPPRSHHVEMGTQRAYRYQSQSVERPPSTQINVPARTRIRSARTRAANIRSRSRDRHNQDTMSTCSSMTGDRDRGRGRSRRNSGASDYGLPPTGYPAGMRQRQGSVTSLLSNKSGHELVQGLEEFRIRNREEMAREQLESQREKHRLEQLMALGSDNPPCSIKDTIRDLEAQLDETLAGLRMEKALVSGELAEEESMFEMERDQLSDVTHGRQTSATDDIVFELQRTITERAQRIDALKNQIVSLDHEMREETLRLNAERDEQIIALQREEKQMANRFGRKTPSYCTGPRTRRRARSGSGYGANGRDTDGASSILSVDSYGSTSNSNWVTDRTAQFPANGESDKHVEEMKRLLLEVQAEKERLIRSLAAGSIENLLASPHDVSSQLDNGPMSPRQNSDSVFEQSVISPIKDSIPQSSSQSISDIGASASQYGNEVTLRSSMSPNERPSKEHRPMTRYMPNTSGSLDLKLHMESLGHSPNMLNTLVITSNALRGQLTKLASRKKRRPWHRWQNRWILFDRVTRSLQWFSDKNEKKPNGVIFFPDIQDVYIDHQNKHKAPNRRIGIVIIASSRRLVLAAKSSEVARVWVDSVVTGCEGNKSNFSTNQ